MKGFLAFAAKAAVSVLLLYLALRLVDVGSLTERLQRVEPGWIAAALATFGLQMALMSTRWARIARQNGAMLDWPRALKFTSVGMFFNQTLPSTIGGDVMRTWLLARAISRWKPAVMSAVIDRAAGLIWLAILVLACLPWSLRMVSNPVGQATVIVIGAAGVLGPAALFALTHIGRAQLQRWKMTQHLFDMVSALRECLVSLRPGASIAAISIAIHLMTVIETWCTAKAIGAPLAIVQSLLLIPPVILISAIPISIAGWGVREGAMVAAFAYGGLPQSDGLAVSVLFGAELFVVGCAGGLVWILSRERNTDRKDFPAPT